MLCGITYEWNLNRDTNGPTYETTGSQTQNRLEIAQRERAGGGMDWRLKLADESFHT